MVAKARAGSLTASEKRIVKKLLEKSWRNQDIQALVNLGRNATINSARVTGVKHDSNQKVASEKELDRFVRIKHSFDPATGLNPYEHERLVRAREAMLLAVSVFNSPVLSFKSELFCILSNIAWTYMFHEHYTRKNVKIVKDNGFSLALSEMISREDCPISSGTKLNLEDMKTLRDKVEHSLLERSDQLWGNLFQANCLNFDRVLCQLFGTKLSLQNELSFSLQFSKANLEQLKEIGKHDVPTGIAALNKEMLQNKTQDQLDDLDYQFSVIYSIVSASKSKAHIQFANPESEEGQDIANVLVKHKAGDDLYPHKATVVANLVRTAIGKPFPVDANTQAWKKHNVRPAGGQPDPAKTNGIYCMYHKAHKDYTYSDAWVDLLVAENK